MRPDGCMRNVNSYFFLLLTLSYVLQDMKLAVPSASEPESEEKSKKSPNNQQVGRP